MIKELTELVKNIKGNVLTIGIDNKIIDNLLKNNKINLYAIFSNDNEKMLKRRNKKKNTNQGKKINIKKLKKYINKKSANYIIIDLNEVYDYYKYIIRDSIYISNNKIILYTNKDIDVDFIKSRYNRYNTKIKVTECNNGYIYQINCKTAKNNRFKDRLFLIKDTMYNLVEFISNVLVS